MREPNYTQMKNSQIMRQNRKVKTRSLSTTSGRSRKQKRFASTEIASFDSAQFEKIIKGIGFPYEGIERAYIDSNRNHIKKYLRELSDDIESLNSRELTLRLIHLGKAIHACKRFITEVDDDENHFTFFRKDGQKLLILVRRSLSIFQGALKMAKAKSLKTSQKNQKVQDILTDKISLKDMKEILIKANVIDHKGRDRDQRTDEYLSGIVSGCRREGYIKNNVGVYPALKILFQFIGRPYKGNPHNNIGKRSCQEGYQFIINYSVPDLQLKK